MNWLRLNRLAVCIFLVLAACGASPPADDAPTIDYRQFEIPRRVGTGLIDGVTPDGSAVYIEDPDPAFPEPGCEGQPESVMFVQPLDGGQRKLAGEIGVPLKGRLVRGGSGGRVAVVAACESFFTDLFIASELPDGALSKVERVKPAVPDAFLLNASTVTWTSDGNKLLAAVQHVDAPDGDPAQIVAIDPGTGGLTKLFDVEQGTGVFGVGQMDRNEYVVATNLVVSFRRSDGTVGAGFQGQGFDISPDGRRLVVFGKQLRLVAQGDDVATSLVEEKPGHEISAARFSPDGKAVVFERYSLGTGRTEISVVSLSDKTLTNIVTGGRYGSALFTGDGGALVFNMFGSQTDAATRAYVVRFGAS